MGGSNYTFLLRIDEFKSAGKDVGKICKTLFEELKNPKKSTFVTKFS